MAWHGIALQLVIIAEARLLFAQTNDGGEKKRRMWMSVVMMLMPRDKAAERLALIWSLPCVQRPTEAEAKLKKLV